MQRLARADRGPALRSATHNHPGGHDIVIQATLGLRNSAPLPLDPQQLTPGSTMVDILMTPTPSPLVQACRARGIRACMGHEMLIQQLPAYLVYFGYGALADELQQDDHPAMEAARAAVLGGCRAL